MEQEKKNYVIFAEIEAEPRTVTDGYDIKGVPNSTRKEGFIIQFKDDANKRFSGGEWVTKEFFERHCKESYELPFGIAVEYAKRDQSIGLTRKVWVNTTLHLVVNQYPFFMLSGKDKEPMGWQPTALDLVAEDWILVK